tara:strand:- start:153 stop:419 length:267 start_codon:yes stop_codon:yes gene_type:complete
MVKKYRVVYDRSCCIGAAACVAVQSEKWEINSEDGKADLIGSSESLEDGKTSWIVEFDDEDLEKFMEAAQVCPVNVIHIYDEDGRKLI